MPAERRGPTGGTRQHEARHARDDKAHDQSARASSDDRPSGEIRPCASLLGTACPRREARHARSGVSGGEAQSTAPLGPTARRSRRSRQRGRGEFLRELAADLRAGTYRPRPYRRREIPKEGGKVRVISIPAIRDRVVQGALRLILEPIFEADFSDSSFGARPGRSAHEAIEKVRTGLRHRRHRVVDVDLSRYFDTIRHDRMLAKVARRISDGQVLAMVKQFLKSTGDQGVPQGSPLSPLLANLALNDLDHVLDRGSGFITYARYLDDMVVLAPDSDKGQGVGRPSAGAHPRGGGGDRRVAEHGEDAHRHDHRRARRLRVPGLRVSVGTEHEDRAVVPVHDSTTQEDHDGPAEGAGHACARAGTCRCRRPSRR